jgi:hypothetical protein
METKKSFILKKPFFGSFFSEDKLMYVNKDMREKREDCDSWEFLRSHFGIRTDNYFSYNPLTKEYHSSWRSYDGKKITEQTTIIPDKIKDLVNQLDWSDIFPQLIVKPFINMYGIDNEVTEEDIKNVFKVKEMNLTKELFIDIVKLANNHLLESIADCLCNDLIRILHLNEDRYHVIESNLFTRLYMLSFIKNESGLDFSPIESLRKRGFVISNNNEKFQLLSGPKITVKWTES